MDEVSKNTVTLINESALEIRNSINAVVMVCEYGSTKNGYHPKNMLKLQKDGSVDLDILLNIKAVEKEANATIYVKMAMLGDQKNKEDTGYQTATIEKFNIKYLNEFSSGLLPQGVALLPGDPYKFRGLISLSMQNMNIGGQGRYAVIVDTKTVTGHNVLLDAFYFEVQ